MDREWKIAILTSKDSWYVPYAKKLVVTLQSIGYYDAKLFYHQKYIDESYEIVFLLSYFKLVPESFLLKHRHNLVVHESALPKGKGWSPLFWQILKGKNIIPIVMFEAVREMDVGPIYMEDEIKLEGHELNCEIRYKQAKKTEEMCLRFLDRYNSLHPRKQRGKETIYKKRTKEDSQLDINKSIKKQFNLLRVVNNEEFPAYFYMKGRKYILKIDRE